MEVMTPISLDYDDGNVTKLRGISEEEEDQCHFYKSLLTHQAVL